MIRAFQWDLARQVERLDVLKKLLPRYAAWGYEELYLHLEDAVHFPGLPGVGRADAYTYEELGELVFAAARVGIKVVPIVNLLGHTQYLIKHPDWRDLNELRDARGHALPQGQVCPLHPRTVEAATLLLRDLAPYCTAGKVHVGLDESFHLGKCPRCRDEVARIGLGGHFAAHVHRLHALCRPHDLQMGLWADMLYFVPEAIPLLPRGLIAYDWYYYPFAKKPRVEFFNFAEHDLVPALRQQGIAYYGCPMNGAFRHEPLPVFGDRLANLKSWWQHGLTVAAEGFLVTSWEANRLALETTTVVDAAAATLWLEPAHDDHPAMLARGVERLFKLKSGRALARTLLAADEHAFAGYARWQINDRWDVFAGTESVKPYQAEERFYRRESARAVREKCPAAIRASLSFRHYLAQRDVFVRQAARSVFAWRRLLAKGDPAALATHLVTAQREAAAFARSLRSARRSARQMWARTRDPQVTGPNETVLSADADRLARWSQWLKAVRKNPALIADATPVCGTWQLQFMVHNFAPAVQKVVVEQRQSDGTWRELAARYTIEFRASAARPHSKLKREFTVPVESPAAGLRVLVRGVGQVAISHATLTNGVTTRRSTSYRDRILCGHPAPQSGFPDITAEPAEPFVLRWV
jgi:hypothetical protein